MLVWFLLLLGWIHVSFEAGNLEKIEIYIGGDFTAEQTSTTSLGKQQLSTFASYSFSTSLKNPSSLAIQKGKWKQIFKENSIRTSGYVSASSFFYTTYSNSSDRFHQILVGGNFTSVNNEPAFSIARLFPYSGTFAPLSAGLNGPVTSMAKIGENLTLVAGNFDSILTTPPIGVRYLAQYDISKDQWLYVGVPSLVTPPSFIIYSFNGSTIWLIGFYERTKYFCTIPLCTKMYVVVGQMDSKSFIDFGHVNGTNYDAVTNLSFRCTSDSRMIENITCAKAVELAQISVILSFTAFQSHLHLLMYTDATRCGALEDCEPGLSSLWRYNTTNLMWELISFGFPNCDCQQNPFTCHFYLNQITQVENGLVISGLYSMLYLTFDLGGKQQVCTELSSDINFYDAGVVYLPQLPALVVMGYTSESTNLGSSSVMGYSFNSNEWYPLADMPSFISPAKISFDYTTNLMVGLYGWPTYLGGTGCNPGVDFGFYRYQVFYEKNESSITWRQEYGYYDHCSSQSMINASWVSSLAHLSSNGVVYVTAANQTESGQEDEVLVVGGAFNKIDDEPMTGLVLCTGNCDESNLYTPIKQAPLDGEQNGSMIVMAGPGQFGIQTLTLDGSDVYVGGQFIWTDSHEYYACNLGRYSTTGKSWEPLGKFVGGFREITSVVFDIYNHCRQLFFCGLFNIELTNGNIAKWVAMYDIETNTWNGVGPGGLGYHDANLLSPFAVSADARYVYIGGESISGQSAAYYWDRTDLNAKWEPLLSSTLVAFEGTVHDIELIPLSPTLENNTNKSFDDHNKNNNYNNNNNNDNNINNKNNDNKNDNNNDNDNDNDNNEYYYYDDAFSDDDDGDSNNNNIYNNVCNVDFGLFACDGSFCPPSAVLVGGNFESLTYRNFARCEIEREHFICLSLGSSDPDNTVRVVLSKNNFTAIGGAFAKVGQLFAPGVAVWDGFEWSDLPGLQNFQGSVMSLSIQQSVLEKRDLWDLRFNLVVFIPIVLIIIFVASLFVYRRRFDQGSGRKYYQYLEIPDDGSRPEVSLAAILESKISVIPSDDLVLGRRLGHGVAGEVFTAKLNKKGSTVPVAVKMLHFYHTSLENGKFLEDFLFEIVMTSGLSHPNVVTFLGVTVDRVTNDVGLVTELMTRGSLADILEDKTKITLDQKIQFSIDISDGLEYLHSIDPPIIHRDLKPANVLVASDWTCKISDLGISTFKRQHEQTMTTVGTPIFMAPEIIALRKYTEIADCYSFAVLLCDVYGEIPPFSEETFQSYSSPAQLLFAVAQDGLRPTIPSENCPVIIQNIISECFSDDPSCRPSAKEISQRLRRASCCPLDPFPRYSPYMETSSVISSEIEIPSSASSSLSSSFSSSFSGTPSSLPSSFSASSSFSQTWASSLSHLFASTKGEKKSPD